MFTFKISPEDAEAFQVKGTSRDISKWEKTTKGASLHKLRTEMCVVDLYRIAYNACTRTGLWTGTLADFEDTVDLDTIDEDDEVDPTQSAV